MEHIDILDSMERHDKKDALLMYWHEYIKASEVVRVTTQVRGKIRAHVGYARGLEKYTVY